MAILGGEASRSRICPHFDVGPLIRCTSASLRGLAPAIVLRGPRQIGKTTLLNQVVDQLLNEGVDPRRLFRLQFDDLADLKKLSMPIVELVEWYTQEVLGETLNKAASEGRAAFPVPR